MDIAVQSGGHVSIPLRKFRKYALSISATAAITGFHPSKEVSEVGKIAAFSWTGFSFHPSKEVSEGAG